MFDKLLIEHCSPTLAGLKTANLFSFAETDPTSTGRHLRFWNRTLNGRGVFLTVLHRDKTRALVYVYRRKRLEKDLNRAGVPEFLSRFSYGRGGDAESALAVLKGRIRRSGSFPHEIGLFLGYPLEDVAGFIENEGRNCKCSGCWKVYCDECEAKKLFAKYDKCRRIYTKRFCGGSSVLKLTVAA